MKISVKKIILPKKPAKAPRKMVNAYNEKCFWVYNGPVLSNLRDLERALNSMTDKQYMYHTALRKNDFAAWVKDVLNDSECAAELLKAETRKKAVEAVSKALKNYAAN